MFGLSELAVILVVVIAVLAVKKGPDLIRSAGKATRILKAETRTLRTPGPGAPEHPGGTSPRDGRP